MIIKIIGMCVVFVSSALIGFCFAECMVSRERELFNLADLIDAVVNELEFTLNPMGQIILSVASSARGRAKLFADTMCLRLNTGESASEAWEYALKTQGRAMSLKQSDCAHLASCGSLFEAYEINEQINRLRIVKTRILQLAERAGKDKSQNCKIARMMGIYGGLLLCVIIF